MPDDGAPAGPQGQATPGSGRQLPPRSARPHVEPPRARPSGDPALEALREGWDRICARLIADDPALAAAAAACRPERLVGDTVHLALSGAAEAPAALRAGGPGLASLSRALSAQAGRPLQVAALPAGGGAADASDTRNAAYRAAQGHPVVQDLLRRFEGEIVAREPSPRERFLARRRTRDGGQD